MSDKLLLLDGPPEPRRLCRAILERAGYSVSHVSDARAAIDHARRDRLLAILVLAEGSEAISRTLQALRRHASTSRLPVLVISPGTEQEVREILAHGGPTWWLEAPFTVRGLLEEVNYVTTPSRSGYQASKAEIPTSRRQAALESHRRAGHRWRDERMQRSWGSLSRSTSRPAPEDYSSLESWIAEPGPRTSSPHLPLPGS